MSYNLLVADLGRRDASVLVWCHIASLAPVTLMGSYSIMMAFEIFVPVLGRLYRRPLYRSAYDSSVCLLADV